MKPAASSDPPTSSAGVASTPVVASVGELVRVRAAVAAAPTPLVAAIMNENVPVVVGVPLIIPVVGLRVSPLGRRPLASEKVVPGEPPAVIRNE